MNPVQSLVPAQRPGPGKSGKPFSCYVNYFRLPDTLKNTKFLHLKVDISYEKIEQNGVMDDEKQISNRDLRRKIFWSFFPNRGRNNLSSLVIFDDFTDAFVTNTDFKRIKETRLVKKKIFILIQPYAAPFKLDLLNGSTAQFSEMVLKTLVTQGTRVVKESNNFFSAGGAVYPIPGRTKSAWQIKIFNDVRAWVGLYASVRSLENKDPIINFALTHKLFHEMDIDLVTFFAEVLNSIDESTPAKEYRKRLGNYSIKKEHRLRLKKALENMRVRVKQGSRGALDFKTDVNGFKPILVLRHGIVKDMLECSAKTYIVHFKKKILGTMEEFYAKLDAHLEFPNLPIIVVECQKKLYHLPMEILFTYDTPSSYRNCFKYFAERQRYIERVSHSPTEYVDILMKAVGEFSRKGEEHDFIQGAVKPELLQIAGRRLRLPKLINANGENLDIYDDFSYRSMQLNECPDKELDFCVVHVRTLEDAEVGRESEEQLKNIRTFFEILKPCLVDRGLKVSESSPNFYQAVVDRYVSDVSTNKPFEEVAEQEKQRWIERFGRQFHEKISCIFLVICDDIKSQYGYIKSILDTKYGFVNQVVDERTVRKALEEQETNRTIFYSLVLKINAKLGGVNINAKNIESVDGNSDMDKVMYIGIDCTHPADDDEDMDITLAIMTGSLNSSGTRYDCQTYAQMKAKEQIECFDTHFTSLMFKYKDENQCYPKHIVVYRDGVSNSQLATVAAHELHSMRNAWKSLIGADKSIMPTFTYIVLQKRHGTRFFAPKNAEGEYKNVKPGSVFDSQITSPVLFDFWLCSQYSKKYTIRPGHYIVIHDDWKLPPDTIYEMTYRLCFLNARCRKPISLPIPIHYADIACSKVKEKYKALSRSGQFKNMGKDVDKDKIRIEAALQTHSLYPGMHFI